ncbi:ImmA/IrrE family metallo-endopeptidase [Paenibacillus sp. GCM10027626]|uniref:ImmA/IrrE family metallo-endopeptidase n=1 Tax=Paenibacillus sp. GCM10027626 TaxID=3273411 RepID=UPI003632325B
MLTEQDLYKIEELAKDKRRAYDLGMGPLGDNMFKVIRSLGIQLVRVPISDEQGNDIDPFAALYLSSKEKEHAICYIGINTTEYWDKQLFALAHELYHHYESSDRFVLCRGLDNTSEIRELKANRFAAEFLLPTERLIHEVKEKNRGKLKLDTWSQTSLLRFVAELHCDYRLPYKAIVRRLHEIQALSSGLLQMLLHMDARDPDGLYWTIGTNISPGIFAQLNSRTRTFGVEGENLGKLIDNYEDGFISLQELSEDLHLFEKSLEDYKLIEENALDENDLSLLYEGDEGES